MAKKPQFRSTVTICHSDSERRSKIGWIIALLVVGMAIGGLVGGAVLHPFLYGFFIASILIGPLWLGSSIIDGIINTIFGKRR